MPSKRVIVLEGSGRTYDVAYWLDVPVARQTFYANPTAVSAWRGPNNTELNDLRTGAVVEVVERGLNFPAGTTLAQIKAKLAAHWQELQDALDNRWTRYGTFLSGDGTTWTDVVVA